MTELEKQNFECVGRILAEIWSETVIDNFDTIASYISPENSELKEMEMEQYTQERKAIHVRESHYFLQVVKCSHR